MAGRIFGYTRVSTDDQDLTLQLQALERYGVDYMYSEHASGKNMQRKELSMLVRVMRRGDTLVVWRLDRLGRTLTGVLAMIEKLNKDGINFVSVTEQFDTTTPMGKAFLQIALVFAELERNMISERTKAGMAAAKAEGKAFGRKRAILDYPKRLACVIRLDEARELRDTDGALLMSRDAVRAALNEADRKAPIIKNNATIKRWQDDGYPGLPVISDPDKMEQSDG